MSPRKLDGFRIAYDKPTPNYDADIVRKWLDAPDAMLADLTEELHRVLDCCDWWDHGNAMLPQVRNGITDLGIWRIASPVSVASVDLLNLRLQTPFHSDQLRHLWDGFQSLKSAELGEAVTDYRRGLQALANWISTRNWNPAAAVAEATDDCQCKPCYPNQLAKQIGCDPGTLATYSAKHAKLEKRSRGEKDRQYTPTEVAAICNAFLEHSRTGKHKAGAEKVLAGG